MVTPLTNRAPLYALLAANAISWTGNVMTFLAVPWFVLETTGSASRAGISGFFAALPVALAAFFGGGVVDRLGHKRASILADVLSGASVALVPLLHLTVGLPFPALLLLVFLGALLDAPGSTARDALLPDVIARARMRPERVNAASDAIQRGSRLLGAPLAGLLIATAGPANVLWVDAATFAVSALLTAVAVPSQPRGARAEDRYLDEIAAGLRFIRRDRLILALVLTVGITNFLDIALAAVIMPMYAKTLYGSAAALGLMVAVFGGAALLGALVFGAVGRRMPRRGAFVGAFIIVGLPLWALAAFPSLAVAAASRAVGGFGAGPLNPIMSTLFQERTPPELRGRVFGAITAIVLVASPLGVLLAGYMLGWIGLRATLLAVAACYLAATLSLLFNPALRDMDLPERAAAPESARGAESKV